MELLHRIIAMNAGKVVRVECRTCGGHHNYRRPKGPTPGGSSPPPGRAATASGRSPAPRSAVARPSARALAAAEAERERTAAWERVVAGQPASSFKTYRATQTYDRGDLIRHGKFGDGYIVRVVDRHKVEAMFRDGPRTLAQALEG